MVEDMDGGIFIIWEDVTMITMTTPLDGMFTQEEVGITRNLRLLDIKIPIQVVETTSDRNCIQALIVFRAIRPRWSDENCGTQMHISESKLIVCKLKPLFAQKEDLIHNLTIL